MYRQLIALVGSMAVEAPDAAAAVVEGCAVGQHVARFGIGGHVCMTLAARIEAQILDAWHDSNIGHGRLPARNLVRRCCKTGASREHAKYNES